MIGYPKTWQVNSRVYPRLNVLEKIHFISTKNSPVFGMSRGHGRDIFVRECWYTSATRLGNVGSLFEPFSFTPFAHGSIRKWRISSVFMSSFAKIVRTISIFWQADSLNINYCKRKCNRTLNGFSVTLWRTEQLCTAEDNWSFIILQKCWAYIYLLHFTSKEHCCTFLLLNTKIFTFFHIMILPVCTPCANVSYVAYKILRFTSLIHIHYATR